MNHLDHSLFLGTTNTLYQLALPGANPSVKRIKVPALLSLGSTHPQNRGLPDFVGTTGGKADGIILGLYSSRLFSKILCVLTVFFITSHIRSKLEP